MKHVLNIKLCFYSWEILMLLSQILTYLLILFSRIFVYTNLLTFIVSKMPGYPKLLIQEEAFLPEACLAWVRKRKTEQNLKLVEQFFSDEQRWKQCMTTSQLCKVWILEQSTSPLPFIKLWGWHNPSVFTSISLRGEIGCQELPTMQH